MKRLTVIEQQIQQQALTSLLISIHADHRTVALHEYMKIILKDYVTEAWQNGYEHGKNIELRTPKSPKPKEQV